MSEQYRGGIGAAARIFRESAGLTQSKVAGEMGVSPSTLWRFERGENTPRDPEVFVARYARAVGVEPAGIWRAALRIEPEVVDLPLTGAPAATAGRVALVALAFALAAFALGQGDRGAFALVAAIGWTMGAAALLLIAAYMVPGMRVGRAGRLGAIGLCALLIWVRIVDLLAANVLGLDSVAAGDVISAVGVAVFAWVFVVSAREGGVLGGESVVVEVPGVANIDPGPKGLGGGGDQAKPNFERDVVVDRSGV